MARIAARNAVRRTNRVVAVFVRIIAGARDFALGYCQERWGIGAIYVVSDPLVFTNRVALNSFASCGVD
jgi:hypothetical protein